MKKLMSGLLSALVLLPGGMLWSGDVRAAETCAAQSPRGGHRANPHGERYVERHEDRRGGYTKDSWSVYYRGRKVEGASVSSFAEKAPDIVARFKEIFSKKKKPEDGLDDDRLKSEIENLAEKD